MNQSRLREGLRALAEREQRGPSAAIEAALIFELHRVRRARRWKAAVVSGALAAGLALGMFLLRPQRLEVREIAVAARPAPVTEQRPVEVAPAVLTRPQRQRTRRKTAPPLQTAAAAEFVEVPFAAPLGAGERAQLLRVSMPATTLASWGFPMAAGDPVRVVNADVLVGENGLARAVRLLR